MHQIPRNMDPMRYALLMWVNSIMFNGHTSAGADESVTVDVTTTDPMQTSV